MATSQNAFIGRTRGRVGGIVFSQWKDKNVIKQKPESVANPRSAQQQANRTRFTALLALGKLLRPIIMLGFKEYATQVTWLNRFMSTNSYSGALTFNTTTKNWDTDYSKVVISEGSLYPTIISAVSTTADVTVSWDPGTTANQTGNDKLMVIAQNNSANVTETSVLSVDRSAGTTVLPLSSATGDTISVVAFFITADKRIVSNSIGLTTTTP